MNARRPRWYGWLFLGALVGCPQNTAIWVAPGSTADSLVLVRGYKRHKEQSFAFGGLRVWSCAKGDYQDGLVWEFEVARDSVPGNPIPGFPSRIRYGEVPRGYAETIPARRLDPGCYGAQAGGLGRVAFRVDSTGAVSELDSLPRLPARYKADAHHLTRRPR